jgi:hypothetical protein
LSSLSRSHGHLKAASVWEGKELRQEVFFFSSGPDRIYGTLFASTQRSGLPGLVVCPPWGWETFQFREDAYSLARRLALRGGGGMVFDWVGHGDSSGEPQDATLSRMIEIAGDAFAQAQGLCPTLEWGFGGVRLGAGVAAVASANADAKTLLMVQPSLDADLHFHEIERKARRASLGRWDAARPWAFGYPLPDFATWFSPDADVLQALAVFKGRAAVSRFTRPSLADLPANVQDLTVEGEWQPERTKLSGREMMPLVDLGIDWLARGDRG